MRTDLVKAIVLPAVSLQSHLSFNSTCTFQDSSTHTRIIYAKGFALIGFELHRIITSIIICDFLQNNISNPKKTKTPVSNRKLNCSKEAREFS